MGSNLIRSEPLISKLRGFRIILVVKIVFIDALKKLGPDGIK